MVASAAERLGYVVISVKDGSEAYRILQKDADFKAVILDFMMPNLGGLDVIRYMRTEKRLMRIPVMMMTSETNSKLTAEILAAGAAVFLPKPFTRDRLQTTLSMLLNRTDGTSRAANLSRGTNPTVGERLDAIPLTRGHFKIPVRENM
jgi:DNA-binding response OmpR family regulator